MAELERIYTIPLGKAYDYIRTKRARRAVKLVRAFLARNMKVSEYDVSISEGINSLIWKRGIQKPPRKLKVKVVKDKEGKVVAALIGELEKKEELKKAEEAKKKEAEKKAAERKKETKKEGKPTENKEAEKKEEKPKEKKEPEKKEEQKPAAQVEKKEKPAQ